MDFNSWRDVLSWSVVIVVALLGAPVTQFLKNQFKLQDKLALVLTVIVSVVLAVGELFLTHQLYLNAITIDNFPAMFGTVFAIATIYYQLLKESPSILGKGFLLKSPE